MGENIIVPELFCSFVNVHYLLTLEEMLLSVFLVVTNRAERVVVSVVVAEIVFNEKHSCSKLEQDIDQIWSEPFIIVVVQPLAVAVQLLIYF